MLVCICVEFAEIWDMSVMLVVTLCSVECGCMPFSTILVVNPGSPGLESSVLVSS